MGKNDGVNAHLLSDSFPFLEDPAWMETVLAASIHILTENGIRIVHSESLEKLARMGFSCHSGRFRPTEKMILDALARLQERENSVSAAGLAAHADLGETLPGLDGWINPYPMMWETPSDGSLRAFTYRDVEQVSRMVDAWCFPQGFTPLVPGTPSDVPPDLSSLARYRIACETCRGAWNLEPTSVRSARWMFEMAHAMDRPIRTLPLYLASPLTMGDESFHMILAMQARLTEIHITCMPSFGINTPLLLPAAWALALAENLGASIVMEALTGLPTRIGPQMFPFDLRDMNMLYGAPESLLFERMTNRFNATLFHKPFGRPGTNIHTHAKQSGVQAVMDKTVLAAAGFSAGSRYFSGLGSLSLDEIFSPMQLMLDTEMLHRMERLREGIHIEPEDYPMQAGTSADSTAALARAWADEVSQDLAAGYTGTDRTLDGYANYVPASPFEDHTSLPAWLSGRKRDMLGEIRTTAVTLLNREPDWSLPDDKRRTLAELYQHAMKEVLP